jgi:pimeloyl-ACP methyl ester carboxylesterase
MTTSATQYVTSADGTRIAYDTNGSGPAVVIVEGGLCHRGMGVAKTLRESLGSRMTVFAYDRRGRGESDAGATPWSVEREVEDLVAVLEIAAAASGATPYVVGASSGGTLALEAGRRGVAIERLAVYETPFILDDTHRPNSPSLPGDTQALVDAGRRGDAVRLFMRTVGVPGAMVAIMSWTPVWKQLKAVAHTLPYDLSLCSDFQQGRPLPEGYYRQVKPETVVIAGGKSPAYLRNAQAAVAAQLPHGRLVTLPGQTHMVKAKPTTPVLLDHFGVTAG